jgi:hypothetical protein
MIKGTEMYCSNVEIIVSMKLVGILIVFSYIYKKQKKQECLIPAF